MKVVSQYLKSKFFPFLLQNNTEKVQKSCKIPDVRKIAAMSAKHFSRCIS